MFAKVEITGTLEVLTGMHIGGSSAFAAIGAVDSPIVRDTLSDMPMIPGSSLKGSTIRTFRSRTTMMLRKSCACLAAQRKPQSSAAVCCFVTWS